MVVVICDVVELVGLLVGDFVIGLVVYCYVYCVCLVEVLVDNYIVFVRVLGDEVFDVFV